MLNVGSKVRVIELEDLISKYEQDEDGTMCIDDMDFIEGMKEYCGTEVTIKEVILLNRQSGVYGIEEDNDKFWWTGEMFMREDTTHVFR